ncbi:MAG: site-2 protease family protein [Elainellaceae cyanobacterium]
MATALIFLTALLLLGWGIYSAKTNGQMGILSWLQSAILLVPWLVIFGLSLLGVFPNLAVMLLLIVISIGLYVILGNRLRLIAQQGSTLSPSDTPQTNVTQGDAVHAAPPPSTAQASTNDGPTIASKNVEEPIDQNRSQPAIPPAVGHKPNAKSKAAQAAQFSQIPEAELAQIRPIFGIDTFFSTETIPYQDGAIFKGNLRGSDPAETHRILSDRLQENVGDRYRLFLLNGPEEKPVVIVLPKSSDPPRSSTVQWLFALLLLAATAATCLEAAGILQGFDFFSEPGRLAESWPIAISLLIILLAHETGHWLQARRHGVRLSPPFFIPAWQIGSFGALTRFESVLPNRSVLFDISVAGPAMGGALSLSFLIVGLFLSHQGSTFQVPSQFFQGSVLVGTLAQAVLGASAFQQPLIDIHPLTIVGWLGLVISAINVMPAGQLDGGRIVQAIYGRKIARRSTIATLIVLAIATLANPLALYWAVLILFLQRDLERPSLNELTEPNDARAAIGLLVLFLTAAVLLPLPPSLAGLLGIGG